MLKFSRRNKKLVIPVGINPNYNIEVKDLYTTKDADVVAGDIIAGKVAYGSDGKIIGSLDISEKVQETYNEGYGDGFSNGAASRQPEIDNLNNEIIDLNSDISNLNNEIIDLNSTISSNNNYLKEINQRLQNINGE